MCLKSVFGRCVYSEDSGHESHLLILFFLREHYCYMVKISCSSHSACPCSPDSITWNLLFVFSLIFVFLSDSMVQLKIEPPTHHIQACFQSGKLCCISIRLSSLSILVADSLLCAYLLSVPCSVNICMAFLLLRFSQFWRTKGLER